MSAVLLPCPFCGNPDARRGHSADCTGSPCVFCLNCGAHVTANTQPQADATWNRRAPPHDTDRAAPLPMTGIFGLLTEDQKRLALGYEGDETVGPSAAMTPTHRSDDMTDKLREAIAALQADDAPTERECGYQDAIDEVLRIIDSRAALAAAPQPARINRRHLVATISNAGNLLGWRGDTIADDLLGRFDITLRNAAAPQPAPADREALVEVIGEVLRSPYGIKDYRKTEYVRDKIADALLARGLRLPDADSKAERDAAFAAGQEEMRERAAEQCDCALMDWEGDVLHDRAKAIRDLPIKPRP